MLVGGGSATLTSDAVGGNTTGVDATGGTLDLEQDTFAVASNTNATDLEVDSGAGTVTIGAGNAFEGSSDYIKDLSAQSFDLSNNGTTFNQLSANQSNPYSIEDKIYDVIDQSGLGLVRIQPDNVYVSQLSEFDELRRDPTRRGCCAGQPGLRPGRELLERPDAARRDHLWNDFRRLVGHGCGDIALRCILGHCGYHGEW